MKIAFFSDCYLDLTGGIIGVINAQKAELERLGHTVYVFSTGFSKSEAELKQLAKQKIFVVPSCRWLFRGLTPVSRRPRIIERWLVKKFPEIKEFDIFYAHYEGGCSIAGLRLGRNLRIPVVQEMHGREDIGVGNIVPWGLRRLVAGALNFSHSWYLPHKMKVRRDNYLAKNYIGRKMWTLMVNHANWADIVVVPSAHFGEKLRHYGVKRPIEVVPNAVKDELVEMKAEVKKLAPGECLRIIWHSRVTPEKRIMPFLMALKGVKGKYRLDVYGKGGDLGRAKRFAEENKLKAVFHGDVKFDEVLKKLEQSHLDVLVSLDCDTFGMTLIEAEAMGVPVMFCDPDMEEVARKGGYVMSRDGSVEAMREALDDLMAHPERIEQMSRVMLKGRERLRQSKRIGRLVQIFKGLERA